MSCPFSVCEFFPSVLSGWLNAALPNARLGREAAGVALLSVQTVGSAHEHCLVWAKSNLRDHVAVIRDCPSSMGVRCLVPVESRLPPCSRLWWLSLAPWLAARRGPRNPRTRYAPAGVPKRQLITKQDTPKARSVTFKAVRPLLSVLLPASYWELSFCHPIPGLLRNYFFYRAARHSLRYFETRLLSVPLSSLRSPVLAVSFTVPFLVIFTGHFAGSFAVS